MQGQPQFADMVAITSGAPLAWTQINALRKAFGAFPVLEVAPAERAARSRGPFTALSQLAADALIGGSRGRAQRKIASIIEAADLQTGPGLDQYVMRLPSANNERFRDTLRRIGPSAVYVIDAGDIETETLLSIDAPFIRYRASVNPAASEAYGGYFALAAGDEAGFGASLHVIAPDGGVGPLIAQQPVPVEKGDNIHTYPWRIAANVRMMSVTAMREALGGRMTAQSVDLPEPAFTRPPLGRYLGAGLTRGVW